VPTGPQSWPSISSTSLLGFGRGGETGGVDPPADLAASSRDLFFLSAVFMLLDGEGFILQVQRVFTRIRSGAAVVSTRGGALRWQCALAADSRRDELQMAASVHWRRILGEMCYKWLQVCGVKTPKGFGFYL
jgi:hypothetical protein